MRFTRRPRALLLILTLTAFAYTGYSADATAYTIEAEDAALGSSWTTATDGGITYITTTVDGASNFPSSESTVATFSLTFPAAGKYELYARVYVGPGSGSDDSFLPAVSLGNAQIGNSEDWSLANQLSGVGYSDPDELILSVGETGSQAWKWIRVSSFSETGLLDVPENQRSQTYRLASREDGFRIDKLAFGPLQVTYTVSQLDQGLPGLDNRQDNDGESFQATGPILAYQKSKFLGSVWSGTSAYNKDFSFYWNGMWHGNAGKWGSVESSRDVMNWTVLDEGYAFAKANGVAFNFHVLLWGAQQPSWINSLEPAEQLEEIKEWMAAVADRYPEIDYLQVVNEPINTAPNGEQSPHSDSIRANYAAALGGEGESGFDWIIEGFRLARQYFPDTPLMINEYGIEGNSETAARYLEIIQALQAEDLIDLVGFQGHAFNTKYASETELQANLDLIASSGLPIMITEMEVDGHDDFVQLAEYQRIFPIYWEHPNVIGINISGHIGNWRYDEGAYLVNDNFTERLALQWLREYVSESPFDSFEGFLAEQELDPVEHAFAADADGDSLETGMEYLLGTDPTATSTPILWQWSDNQPQVDIPLSSDARNGIVKIQSSPDLQNWQIEASFDLHLLVADGLEIITANGARSLRYVRPSDTGSETFFRISYE